MTGGTMQFRRPSTTVRDPDAPVEPNEIRAAAEEHMLAVIDDLADARMRIGRSAPAKIAAPLDQFDA